MTKHSYWGEYTITSSHLEISFPAGTFSIPLLAGAFSRQLPPEFQAPIPEVLECSDRMTNPGFVACSAEITQHKPPQRQSSSSVCDLEYSCTNC